MAYEIEKSTGDIVVNGFENGIQPSPHKGLANIQNANISTEMGEVMNSFARIQDTMTSTATGTGTLAYADSSHVSLSISGSNNLFKGNWISVTNSSNTGELPNGTYYVPPSSGANFQLSTYYNTLAGGTLPATVNYLIVGGGAGGATSGVSAAGGGGGGGQVLSGTASVSATTYSITVATSVVAQANGNTSSAFSNTALGGVGTANIEGGASGSGKAGGMQTSSGAGGGGGGGDSTAGSNTSTNVGTNGGNGTVNSITSSSITYGGGGGGGGASGAGAGAGGTGGGGGGGNAGNVGTAGTANTGGGGGGGAGGVYAGGAGASGIVIIKYPTASIIGATGGTITQQTISGVSYNFHTFTVGGNFVVPAQQAASNPLTGFTTGLTATIQLIATMGKPLASCTETYFNNGTVYNRYYVLDNQNLVWVYDTQNETTYVPSDNVSWFLPDFQTNWCTAASGIAVISGFLIGTASNGAFAKSVALLGNTNSTTTTWVQIPDLTGWSGGGLDTSIIHFAYTSHAESLYITDASYVVGILPNSAIADPGVSTSLNIQSFASWTDSSTVAPAVYSVISGTSPIAADDTTSIAKRTPAVFFTENGGSLPASLSAGKVYYIGASPGVYSLTIPEFYVFADPTIPIDPSAILSGTVSVGATTGTLSSNWTYATETLLTTFSGGDVRQVLYTQGSTAISWTGGLVNSATSSLQIQGNLDLFTGKIGLQYFNTFYPVGDASSSTGSTPTYTLSNPQLALPVYEIAQCMTEIGATIVVGCKSNTIYPWNQVATQASSIISLPENNVVNLITVNQMAYIQAGNKGNIYITDGSVASLVTSVPDYCAGVPGNPASYIEPVFSWGGAMYLRGRVYFSILDQTSTKAGNCGGIWSFVPTQNFYVGQDIGISLRLENQSSYGTYNGYAPVLIPKQNQNAIAPQYFSAWESSVTSPSYGIDATGTGTAVASVTVIETDLIPVGTMLKKKTFGQIEYKVSSPLQAGESVSLSYRPNATAAWIPCGNLIVEQNGLSGYYVSNTQQIQWVQLQAILTPITGNGSFNRLTELRIR